MNEIKRTLMFKVPRENLRNKDLLIKLEDMPVSTGIQNDATISTDTKVDVDDTNVSDVLEELVEEDERGWIVGAVMSLSYDQVKRFFDLVKDVEARKPFLDTKSLDDQFVTLHMIFRRDEEGLIKTTLVKFDNQDGSLSDSEFNDIVSLDPDE